MPQNFAVPLTIARKPGNYQTTLNVDAQNALQATAGGINSALAVSAARVIKAAPGRICRVVCCAGTLGFTINDCATVGAASASNEVFSVTSNTVGQIFVIDWPCATGIVISAIGASGQLSISFS